jgi:hypothetical protein
LHNYLQLSIFIKDIHSKTDFGVHLEWEYLSEGFNPAERFQHHQYLFGNKYITVCTLDSADFSYAIL